jgi:hypothetical protein
MQPARFIATVLAAGLLALGLSVGAAMAEGPQDSGKPGKAHYTPKGLCLLKDAPKK